MFSRAHCPLLRRRVAEQPPRGVQLVVRVRVQIFDVHDDGRHVGRGCARTSAGGRGRELRLPLGSARVGRARRYDRRRRVHR